MRTALIGAGAVLPIVKYLRDEPGVMGSGVRQDAPGSLIRLRHGVTHYELAGPAEGEPVLFLSGATLPLWIWDGLFEKVASAGARAIRYDRYGMGFSDRPDIDYDYDLFEAQILDLLDHLGIKRPVTVVALAFGGPIAAEFAVRNSQRVARVCMIAPDGFGVPLNLGLRIAMLPVIGEPFFKIIGDRALLARVPGYSQDRRVVTQIEARFRPELRYKGFKRALLSALRHVPIHGAEYLYRYLNTCGIPLQILWGDNDRVTPPPSQDVVNEVFSNADVRFFDGVGHLPHFERLDETVDALAEFMSSSAE